jgi:hypothetical protein
MHPKTLIVALVEVLTGDRPRVREGNGAVEIVLTRRHLGRLARCAELAEP